MIPVSMVMGLALVFLQDPSLEEILREFEKNRNEERFREQLRDVSDATTVEFFNETLADETLSESLRLDLAEALAGTEGVDREELFETIASGDGSAIDRLRAINGLQPLDAERADELASEVMPDVTTQSLSSPDVLAEVVLLARTGNRQARQLLLDALEDDSLAPEVRFDVAEALRTLEGVATVDELLRSLVGLQRSDNPEVAAKAKKMETDLKSESDPAPSLKRNRTRKKPAPQKQENGSTLHWNLTILSVVILLSALYVLSRRTA